jgi:hypothetical protein
MIWRAPEVMIQSYFVSDSMTDDEMIQCPYARTSRS